MEKHGLDLDDGTSRTDIENDPLESKRKLIETWTHTLEHACQCREAYCRLPSCQKMKRVVSHTKSCKTKTNVVCKRCKPLIVLCLYHAKHCTENKCKVLFCEKFKQKLREQQRYNQLLQDKMLERRKAMMQGVKGSQDS